MAMKDTRGMIEITGVDLRNFIRACYAPSRAQGLGVFHYQPGDLDDAVVAEIIARGEKDHLCAVSMDYVQGRSIKMTVYRGEGGGLFINNNWFDHSRPMLAKVLDAVGMEGERLVAEAVAADDRKQADELATAESELPKFLAGLSDGPQPYDYKDTFHWRTSSVAEDRDLIKCSYADKMMWNLTDAGRAALSP